MRPPYTLSTAPILTLSTNPLLRFFAFSLREALARAGDGAGIKKFFSLWDGNGDGRLSTKEFERITHDLGFDSITKDLQMMCALIQCTAALPRTVRRQLADGCLPSCPAEQHCNHKEPTDRCTASRSTSRARDRCDADGDRDVTLSEMTRALRLRTSGKRAHDFVRTASRIAKAAKEAGGRVSRWGAVRETHEHSGAAGFVDMKDAQSGKVRNGASATKGRAQILLDVDTQLAIAAAFSKVDTTARTRKGAFYRPEDERTRAAEDVGPALSVLRSWMRKMGLSPLDVFQSWDVDGSYQLTRHELHRGLRAIGLTLSKELLTLVFDHLAEGYHLTYDEWKVWFDSTSAFEQGGDAEDEEERRARAAVTIQRHVRSRTARKRRKSVERQGVRSRAGVVEGERTRSPWHGQLVEGGMDMDDGDVEVGQGALVLPELA